MPKPYPNSPLPAPPGTPRRRSRAMTLVEIVIAMVVFSLVILGTLTVLMFSMRTVDDSRSFTQVTQILNHEMESMRMRAWLDRTLVDSAGNKRTLHGISTLGNRKLSKDDVFLGAVALDNDPTGTQPFTPFAVYGKQIGSNDEKRVAVISGSNSYDLQFVNKADGTPSSLKAQYRNALGTAAGFRCKRQVNLLRDGCGANYAVVTLTVAWDDLRGRTHSRSMSSTMAENGLNSVIYDLSQVQ